jgi:hypothetical protein
VLFACVPPVEGASTDLDFSKTRLAILSRNFRVLAIPFLDHWSTSSLVSFYGLFIDFQDQLLER